MQFLVTCGSCWQAGWCFSPLSKVQDEGRKRRHHQAASPLLPKTQERGFVLSEKSIQLLPPPRNSIFSPQGVTLTLHCTTYTHKNPKQLGLRTRPCFRRSRQLPVFPIPQRALSRLHGARKRSKLALPCLPATDFLAPFSSARRGWDWDPANRLLALRTCCSESQTRPGERFSEFLLSGGQAPNRKSQTGMKNGILVLWS